MASWVALNVEPDESVEEEVDDTKEIQIEEALKLYQTALRLHSLGPQYHAEAEEAYDALFKSEIFKYPESASEFKRSAQDSELQPSAVLLDGTIPEPLADFHVTDSTSSILLQTIFLSYKNHGQFALDSLNYLLKNSSPDGVLSEELTVKVASLSRTALADFAEALERDDTDLDLWRRSARLSSGLQSFRLARFCLESVLADDENRLEVRAQQLGLDETLAHERLRHTLLVIDDRLSICQIPVKKPKKPLLQLLNRQTDPYPFLPALPENLQNADASASALFRRSNFRVLVLETATWETVGSALLQALVEQENLAGELPPGAVVRFRLPADAPDECADLDEDTEALDGLPLRNEPTNREIVMEADRLTESGPSPTTNPNPEFGQIIEDQSLVDHRAERQLIDALEGFSEPVPDKGGHPRDKGVEEAEQKPSISLSRKRSTTSAANDEPLEGGRLKSRRTRARESNADTSAQNEEIAFDQSKYFEDRLEPYMQADERTLQAVNSLMSKIGVQELVPLQTLRKIITAGSDEPDIGSISKIPAVAPFRDLQDAINRWSDERYRHAFQEDPVPGLQGLSSINNSGLAVFLEHSKRGTHRSGAGTELLAGYQLQRYLSTVNSGRCSLQKVALGWLERLLMPAYGKYRSHKHVSSEAHWSGWTSTYQSAQWSAPLKETVVQVLLHEDDYIYRRLCERTDTLDREILSQTLENPFRYNAKHIADLEMIQTIFELHIEVYALMNSPNSEVDQGERSLQSGRVARWAILARSCINHFLNYGPSGPRQEMITLRHLWASTFHSNMATDTPRAHVLLCLEDLKDTLQRLSAPVYLLINNAVMPEISAAAIDQEISKLNLMDFFLTVFSPELEDPVTLIETIEPILEPSSPELSDEISAREMGCSEPRAARQEMVSFLDRGDSTLRLVLWKRLQDAYRAIEYPPKVFSCLLRSMEAIVKEICHSGSGEIQPDQRQLNLLRWLKSLDGILSDLTRLTMRYSDTICDSLDMDHVRSSLNAIARLLTFFHLFTMYEDALRVGQVSIPDFRSSTSKSLDSLRDKLRDMEVRCWVLLYTLFREAIAQSAELFDTASDDRADLLRAIHGSLGVRSMCKNANKQFLKLLKSELLSLKTEGDYSSEICQVLFDLHGIKILTSDEHSDHGCLAEKLDRSTAAAVVELVTSQARRMSMKDLCKSELKITIEKIKQSLGAPKSSSHVILNRRVLNAYITSPINPVHLVRCAQGVADISIRPVAGAETSSIARTGWYFLLGSLGLTKFRSQKHVNAVPTTDLDEAIQWFKKDLEHGDTNWETWYRLAQAFDTKLEEDVTWSADKINNHQAELAACQRSAINCYAMAVATAMRNMDATTESRALLSDLYTDFGIRLYASTREPFHMEAFSLEGLTRHFNNEESQETYSDKPFKEMRPYAVWNFASYLFRQALSDQPKRWMNHYMLSKCLWKMFRCKDSVKGHFKRIKVEDILDSLLDAIDSLPPRKDSRYEPIFEPHLKLVSVIHKLVQTEILTPAEGSRILLANPWARKVKASEDHDSWKPYILEVLRNMKNADKSNWHHRMAVKIAHIIYDGQEDSEAAAAAKNELTPQIFTKTMTIQVWKPEFERPGRHFVYTTRYVYFFVTLLDQLSDRASLDQLLRKIRKKQSDFVNHTRLWEDVSTTYARVVRRIANIEEGHEERIFRPLTWDEFVTTTTRLENLPELSPESALLLEPIRDCIELKKLNNHLMKVTFFEDLIADLYSRVYELNAPRLIQQAGEENKERIKVDHVLMGSDGAADTPTPPTSAPAASEAPVVARGRTKGIARRDIQKRAESIVNCKMNARAVSSKSVPRLDDDPIRQTASGGSVAVQSSAGRTSRRAGTDREPLSRPSSIPPSVHDSADDESELSEIDDENLAKLLAERKQLASFGGADGLGSEMSDFDEDGDRHRDRKVSAKSGSLLFPNLLREQRTGEPGSELSVPGSDDEGDEAGRDEESIAHNAPSFEVRVPLSFVPKAGSKDHGDARDASMSEDEADEEDGRDREDDPEDDLANEADPEGEDSNENGRDDEDIQEADDDDEDADDVGDDDGEVQNDNGQDEEQDGDGSNDFEASETNEVTDVEAPDNPPARHDLDEGEPEAMDIQLSGP